MTEHRPVALAFDPIFGSPWVLCLCGAPVRAELIGNKSFEMHIQIAQSDERIAGMERERDRLQRYANEPTPIPEVRE